MSDINQAGRPPAMKPFSYTSHTAQGQRPHRRTGSNSSASSAASAASAKSHEQFVFSPHQTPASEKEPFFSHQEYSGSQYPQTHTAWRVWHRQAMAKFHSPVVARVPAASHEDHHHRTNAVRVLSYVLAISSSQYNGDSGYFFSPFSQHINFTLLRIDEFQHSTKQTYCNRITFLCVEKDQDQLYLHTNSATFCASGYFPFHEDPEERIHRPHPFHTAEKEARRDCDVESLARSFQGTKIDPPLPVPDRRASIPSAPFSAPPGEYPMLHAVEMPSSRSHTPVTSYVPSGLHEAPMPVGKYYPSNYEQRQKKSHHTSRSDMRPISAGGPSSVKSDTVVPQLNRTDARGRPDSEAKTRLLQYQRDMITQAQLAKQRLEDGGSSTNLAAAGLHGASLHKLQKINSRGPRSPRLQPLGSPGPVTPLALEGADGYLSARSRASPRDRPRPVLSPDAGRESHAIAKAMKAHDERRRREGRGSPAVEAGGFGF
ncbi:hypothetical protein J7T55_012075 [Diaporthe amygdali]|uniref:uncharacterized protein n=1 Tax=Phomopsis amygdali TaxID=1214568 RepID=UPI0022FEF404|nr:uncharacterized protein J7T55_012075 [Diaporthe amygdali]KAJ0123610.1 hypothetical protein J7T55_012075 [Diaporthe amygdali]